MKRSLSPLARGTRSHYMQWIFLTRFIPAGAGNTRHRANGLSLRSVYPRWRGEHSGTYVKSFYSVGLSPLARGTLRWRTSSGGGSRFIPAGAGNTDNHLTYFRTSPVYPRWRGEHHDIRHVADFFTGLSPLARGTPTHRREHQM